ncbi:MAG TPA: hypothetical protein VG457_06885, partial [Planctomycetota bacterium]|nr:hypothetical protein [Planctomycetota bacterium]
MMRTALLLAALGLLGMGCQAPPGPETPLPAEKQDPVDAPAVEGPEGERAFRDLEEYYRDPSKIPGHAAALQELGADDPAVRRSAGRYLLALLRQMTSDETNGRASWTATGFWGGGSESPSRSFRKTVADALALQARGDECLDAIEWLLNGEKLAEHHVAGLLALQRIESPRSAGILKALLQDPHPNGEVLAGALHEAGRRGLKELAPRVVPLLTHYRTAVRAAAREVAPALGIVDLPAFVPEEAITPALARMLLSFTEMVSSPIPEKAPWCRFVVTHPPSQPGKEPQVEEFSGWFVGERDGNQV